MRIKPFQAVYPNFDLIASADEFFGTVKYDYRDYDKSGFFKRIPGEAMYVYIIDGPNKHHQGIVASIDINDYLEGRILKHENTLSTKEQSMMSLLLNRKAMIKPVLLTYPSMKTVNDIINTFKDTPPLYTIHFDESQEDHKIWKVTDEKVLTKLSSAFAKIQKVYIADGHHRCSTSALLHKSKNAKKLDMDFSHVLCTFLSYDQLVIHDYNRVVHILDEISPLTMMAELSRYCKIKKMDGPFRPQRKHEMSMFLEKEWFRLRWKNTVLKAYAKRPVVLDASIITDLIMKRIFGIKDVRSDKRIRYIEGTQGHDGLVMACRKKENSVGFGLYPVSMDEFIKLSDLGEILPPKSTWFEPRMKNGLITQEF